MAASYLKYPFAPILMVQGRRVRRDALVLPEPAGDRKGVTGAGPDLRLLIVGDSSAAGVGVDDQRDALSGQLVQALASEFRLTWQLEAKTGNTTAQTAAHLCGLAPGRFDIAVVALGVNDVTSGMPLWLWKRQTLRLQTVLRSRFGVRHIIHSGLPPLHDFPLLPRLVRVVLGAEARRFQRALGKLCDRTGDAVMVPGAPSVTPEQMARDGFHPGPLVYAAWAGALADAIRSQASHVNLTSP